MTSITGSLIGCGISQLYHLGTLAAVCQEVYSENRSLEDDEIGQTYIFSDVVKKQKRDKNGNNISGKRVSVRSPGVKLAADIKRRKLGSLKSAGPRLSPHTGNIVDIWIWVPNNKALALGRRAAGS